MRTDDATPALLCHFLGPIKSEPALTLKDWDACAIQGRMRPDGRSSGSTVYTNGTRFVAPFPEYTPALQSLGPRERASCGGLLERSSFAVRLLGKRSGP